MTAMLDRTILEVIAKEVRLKCEHYARQVYSFNSDTLAGLCAISSCSLGTSFQNFGYTTARVHKGYYKGRDHCWVELGGIWDITIRQFDKRYGKIVFIDYKDLKYKRFETKGIVYPRNAKDFEFWPDEQKPYSKIVNTLAIRPNK